MQVHISHFSHGVRVLCPIHDVWFSLFTVPSCQTEHRLTILIFRRHTALYIAILEPIILLYWVVYNILYLQSFSFSVNQTTFKILFSMLWVKNFYFRHIDIGAFPLRYPCQFVIIIIFLTCSLIT